MQTPYLAGSPPAQGRQAALDGCPDRGQFPILALARTIGLAQLVVAGSLVLLPCAAQASGSATTEPVINQVELLQRGSCAHDRWFAPLIEQESTQWLDSVVAFFTPIAPECCLVAKQHTQQECNDRDRRVVQDLEDQRQHAALNVVVAALTLIAGFALGLGGGR